MMHHTWKKVVESDKHAHLEAGLQFQQVWINDSRPNEIFFIFRADDLEKQSIPTKAGAQQRDVEGDSKVTACVQGLYPGS